MLKVAIYLRYSSSNQSENSIETQREGIENFCKIKNYHIVEEYCDRAYSATNDKRPQFQLMIERAMSTDCSWYAIVVFDYSRFSRSEADAHTYRRNLESKGIKLISATQDFGDSVEASLMVGFQHAIDAQYSRTLAAKTHSGMRQRAKQGFFLGGQPPLGYKKSNDGKLEIDAETAPAVKRAFELCELGYSKKEIANQLNEEGFHTSSGGTFKPNSMTSILKQEKYTGKYIWNRARAKDSFGSRNNSKSKALEEQIIIENGCPQLISEDQFRKVQSILSSHKGVGASIERRHHYMLSGLGILYCAECGAAMVGNPKTSHGKKYFTYSCPNHKKKKCSTKDIRKDELEEMVGSIIADSIIQRCDWNEISKDLSDSEEIKKLKNRLLGLSKSIDNLSEGYANSGSFSLLEKLKVKEQERSSVEQQLQVLRNKTLTLNDENREKVREGILQLLISSKDPEVRTILKQAVTNITVSNKNIKATLVL